MRLFVGIALEDGVAERLKRLTGALRRADDGLRWSAPEAWHVTLQFLGGATEAQYACLAERLRTVEAGPVTVRLSGTGTFERAGVFFAEVEVSPELTALAQDVAAATARCGFVPEERPYHPHITLARRRDAQGAKRLRELGRVPAELQAGFVAQEFLLYESRPAAGGSEYIVRERFSLRP